MEEQIKTAPQTDVEVVDIQFRSGQKIYFFDPDGQRFADGDHIIIDTARGEEFGICVGGNHKIPPKNVVAPLRKVLRRATPQDEKTIQENRAKEKRAGASVCGLGKWLYSSDCRLSHYHWGWTEGHG